MPAQTWVPRQELGNKKTGSYVVCWLVVWLVGLFFFLLVIFGDLLKGVCQLIVDIMMNLLASLRSKGVEA